MNPPPDHTGGHFAATNPRSAPESRIAELRHRIEELEAEKHAIELEQQQIQSPPSSELKFEALDRSESTNLRPDEKIALFLKLFGARKSVYPKLWENAKTGKKGLRPCMRQ